MRHHFALVLALGSSLVGCVAAPQPNPQTLSTRSPGGVWNDCLAAIERGVAGDRCNFDPEVTGTAESCASLLPPGIVGWETIGGQRVPIAETDLDVAAHCSDGRLVLNRVHEADPAPRSEPTIEASGCLSYTLPPELGENVRLCVEDDLLPELATSEDADLDRPGACEDVLDGVVLPGTSARATRSARAWRPSSATCFRASPRSSVVRARTHGAAPGVFVARAGSS